ncbi:DUF2332 domain-containing protein [Microbacterium sp. JZ31]|uniref:DUF2332 domain-containing protein n=1 Tax=Microbacterium sp. JZ31 TaxID=1906274 RepID=UPI00193313BB|nr:DUF2332 domain-containing protein [Microbacterium sp. JZ31]
MQTDERGAVAERFARFAREEAPGRSDTYLAWARTVSEDAELCDILARVPATHRQPPLVFAVTRMLGAPRETAGWSQFVRAHADAVVAECSARSLQTNEPLRCAALLPALCLVPGPIALLELGASGGLCLYPDRYAYRYGDTRLGASTVVLEAEVRGAPLPELALQDIVWRAGIDLQPLDARVPADRAWLEGLVWPEEHERAARIAAALDIVAADPPLLVPGDVADLDVVRAVAAQAPADATLVVTTPGVLPYVPRARRDALIAALTADAADPARVRAGGVRWITLDQPRLHDAWRPPIDADDWPGFALALDGRVLAAADPLGSWIDWRA